MARENIFLQSLLDFQEEFENLKDGEEDLLTYKKDLEKKLKNIVLPINNSLNNKNELSQQRDKLKKTIQRSIEDWGDKWSENSPMRDLSETYSNRVIFLVFGKVNAGKSSFSNFLAELFSNEDTKRFQFEDGSVKYIEEKFKEGVVETTASIQGIELGQYLVLLDTPGLHSVTDENGDLTRKFTDSADAILWLTPSTSPGQVQELDDLKAELESKKPLQPVITRSDFFEEDIDDNDDIITFLRNKKPDNRKLQEDDVYERASEKLSSKKIVIKKPLSISVHAYQQSNKDKRVQDESGLTQLYVNLADLLEEAKNYKVIKAKQQVINYLDNSVLKPLNSKIKLETESLYRTSVKAVQDLDLKKKSIVSEVVLSVCLEIPELIEEHKNNKDKKAISKQLNSIIEQTLQEVLDRELRDYTDRINRVQSSLSPDDLGDFEDVTIDIEQISGSALKAAAAGGGAIAGMAAGAAVGSAIPIVGTFIGGAIGGVLGGFLGDKGGDYLIETETITETVGINSEKIIQRTTKEVEQLLPKKIDEIINNIIISINLVKDLSSDVSKIINDFEAKISQLKGDINV